MYEMEGLHWRCTKYASDCSAAYICVTPTTRPLTIRFPVARPSHRPLRLPPGVASD
jgi:hypothetical protein